MNTRVQEIYEILVQTSGGTDVTSLVTQLDRANKSLRETQQVAGTFGNGLKTVNRESKLTAQSIQQASFQVGDFFVQVAGGTNALRALGQQLPQLLGSFGMIGAVAGAAVAALSVLPMIFAQTGEKAEEASKTLDSFLDSLRRSTASPLEIKLEFSGAEEGVTLLREMDTLFKRQASIAAYKEQLDGLGVAFSEAFGFGSDDIQNVTEQIDEINKRIQELRTNTSPDFNLLPGADDNIQSLENKLKLLELQLGKFADVGLPVAQTREFFDLLNNAQQADSLEEIRQAFVDIAQFVERTGLDLAALPDELRPLVEQAVLLGNEMEAIVSSTENAERNFRVFAERIAEAVGLGDEMSEAIIKWPGYISAASSVMGGLVDMAERARAAFDSAAAALRSMQGANIGSADRLAGEKAYAETLEATGDRLSANAAREQELLRIEVERQRANMATPRQEAELNDLYRQRAMIIADTTATQREIEEINKRIAAANKGAGGGGGGAAADAAKGLTELTNALTKYRTESEEDAIELAELNQLWAQYGSQLQNNAEYTELMRRAQADLAGAAGGLREELDSLAEVTGTALGEGLADLAFNAKSTSEAFKDMAKTIITELGKILAKWLTFKILTAGFGFDVPSPFGAAAYSMPTVAASAGAGGRAAPLGGVPYPAARYGRVLPSPARATGNAAQPAPVVIVNNNAPGTRATARTEGDRTYVTVEEVQNLVANAVISGGNAIAQSLERTYRVNRAR